MTLITKPFQWALRSLPLLDAFASKKNEVLVGGMKRGSRGGSSAAGHASIATSFAQELLLALGGFLF